MPIFGPRETCPQCNQPDSFGRLWINSSTLDFVCDRCRHRESKPLPPISKRIIYIDQFALSKMVKNKDDPFWTDVHSRLVRLASNEVITCPCSPIHVEESEYDYTLRDALKDMYRSIAGDDEFRRPKGNRSHPGEQ